MEIDLKNVGIIKEAHLEFKSGLNLIIGPSSSGKSTLLRAIRSMMDNTFADSNITFGQKKMAIRIKDDDNSATYIRDLENASKKSAYQINGQIYTKLGRNSLDALSALFKIAPVEIDGEKINFNFSAQFSGPFLLLGSTSLLYSILTYRSTFDITRINDLYFSDYKKVKQDITVSQKTKEALEIEERKLKNKYDILSPVTTLFNDVQKIKQDKLNYDSLSYLNEQYKQIKSQLASLLKQKEELNNILPKYDMVSSLFNKVSELNKYTKLRDEVKELPKEDISCVECNLNMLDTLSKKTALLSRYARLSKAYKEYNKLHSSLSSVPDTSSFNLGISYLTKAKELKDSTDELNKYLTEYSDITEQINKVGICPLCKQPINMCKD